MSLLLKRKFVVQTTQFVCVITCFQPKDSGLEILDSRYPCTLVGAPFGQEFTVMSNNMFVAPVAKHKVCVSAEPKL